MNQLYTNFSHGVKSVIIPTWRAIRRELTLTEKAAFDREKSESAVARLAELWGLDEAAQPDEVRSRRGGGKR